MFQQLANPRKIEKIFEMYYKLLLLMGELIVRISVEILPGIKQIFSGRLHTRWLPTSKTKNFCIIESKFLLIIPLTTVGDNNDHGPLV